MTPAQLAWVGAVVETRGKIRCTASPLRNSVTVILQVQSSRIPVVERLGAMTGVELTLSEAKKLEFNRRACEDHCTEPHVHVLTELPAMALWAVRGAAAAIVLDNIIPYIVVNAGLQLVVDNVIESLPKWGQGRHAIDLAIVRLRKLGWRIPDALWPQTVSEEDLEDVPAAH